MGKRRKITILDKKFRSHRKCRNYVREFLRKMEHKGIFSEETYEYQFLHSLIKRHERYKQKISPGLLGFKVCRNIGYKMELRVCKVDGSEEDISWVRSITGVYKSYRARLTQAMRYAINDTIQKVRNSSNNKVCRYCKENIGSFEDFHVDHIHPTFAQLQMHFWAYCPKNVHPKDFGNCPRTGISIFLPEDKVYEEKWRKFHDAWATFGIAHHNCNSANNGKVKYNKNPTKR